MKMKRIFQFMTMAAVAALLAGCEEEEKYQLRFSHYLHVEDVGAACSDCHGEPGEPNFNVISHATCLDCHDEPEAEEVSADTCGMCHEEKQVAMFSLVESDAEESGYAAEARPGSTVFVHTEAVAGKCTDCHDNLMAEDLQSVPVLERSDVLAIRNKAHMSGQACSTCHVDMDAGIAPASHDVAWTKRHGTYFRQDDAACSVCHTTEDSCTACHSVMQPSSHTDMFRTRTHGVMAGWSRTDCQVCHVEDSCTSCHATTRPRSHNTRWGSGFKPTHCIGCHDTSTPGDGCATCHEDGNDVMLHAKYWGGASINHNQPGIENCYQCHWTQTP